MKTMVVPFEVKQVGEEDEFFTFKGYASTFGNTDRGGDVVVKGAFLDSIEEMKAAGDVLSIFWQHDSHTPLGIFPVLGEDDKGLFVEGKMPKDDTFVSGRVIPQMKVGSVRKMSIGYTVIDEELTEGGRVRLIKKARLWEASLVSIPMNNEADVTEMKAAVPFQDLPLAERSRPWDAGQAIARVWSHTGSEDGPSPDYKKAFLWYDSDNAEEFDSYNLLIADVIDDRLRAIPRAIFAVAASLARGDVDIPDTDRSAVIAHINHYYVKMGLESPFRSEAGFRLDDLSVVEVRDLEKMFREGVSFSRKDAKTLIGLIESSGLRDANEEAQRDAGGWGDVMSSINQTKTMMEEKNA